MSIVLEKKSPPSVRKFKKDIEISNKQMLNYVNEQELIRCVGPDHYKHLKNTLSKKLNHRVSLKEIKHEIVTNAYYQKLIQQLSLIHI